MSAAGFAPLLIFIKLRNCGETDALDILVKDVTNFLAKQKKEVLNSRLPIEWLYD